MQNGNFTYLVVINDSPDLKLGFTVYVNSALSLIKPAALVMATVILFVNLSFWVNKLNISNIKEKSTTSSGSIIVSHYIFVQSISINIIMHVISSITVSFSFHFYAAALTNAFPAASGECLTKYGHTISATYSFSKNSHTPSEASTRNLSSLVSVYWCSSKKLRNRIHTWVGDHTDTVGLVISEGAGHGQARWIFMGEPDSTWTEGFTIGAVEGVHTAAHGQNSLMLQREEWFVVLRKLGYFYATLGGVGAHHTSWITRIRNENWVLVEEDWTTCRTTIFDINFKSLPQQHLKLLLLSQLLMNIDKHRF